MSDDRGGAEAPGGGRVILVGTPIGNLGDLSPRARQALEQADLICCEDTRRTRKLLTATGLAGRPLSALHAHNEVWAAPAAAARAAAGATVVVVTDAGMPGVSDPGERVVRAALDAGVPVGVVPGPTALVTAVVASGLPAGRFCFEGFLPVRGQERRARLDALAVEPRTSVLYEAPHRVVGTVADLIGACGEDRPVAACRELTKLHEEIWRGDLGGARDWLEGAPPRGEWVLVLGGATPVGVDDERILGALALRRRAGDRTREAVLAVSAELALPRSRVYSLALDQSAERAPELEDGGR